MLCTFGNMKTLSLYTIAKNCTDINDITAGITELRQYIEMNPNTVKLAYKRLNALLKKQSLFK